MKLIDILKEIGDSSAGSFPFKSKSSAIKTNVKKLTLQLQQSIELNRKIYKNLGYKFDPQDGGISLKGKTFYTVKGNSGLEYSIKISYRVVNKPKDKSDCSSTLRVDFSVRGSSKLTSTNANEQYKLISTVVAVVIDFANSVESMAPLTQVDIYPMLEPSEKVNSVLDSKRARLYRAYVNKNLSNLPGDWTVDEEKNKIVVKRN